MFRTHAPRVLAGLGVAVVAVVAAIVSYAHMHQVARIAGEEWRATLLPLSVDGLVVAASLGAWQAKRRGEPVPGMTLLSLSVGLAVSVAANVAVPFLPSSPEQAPATLSAAVAAWPAFALALAFEELLRFCRTDHAGTVNSPATQDVSADVPQDSAPVPPVPAERSSVPETQGEEQGTPDAADDREAARDLIRAGWPMTGKDLGDRFGKSDRWGRSRIAEVQAEQEPAELASVS